MKAGTMEKALLVIDEMVRLGIFRAYAIGGGIAATYYIEPVLTYDLDVFFVPIKAGMDELAPIYAFARERGFGTQAEAILIEGFPVLFIPAYNELVLEAVRNAATLKYRDVEARVVTAEYLAAIALQTGRAKDRERVSKLMDEANLDRSRLDGILKRFGLAGKLKKLGEPSSEE